MGKSNLVTFNARRALEAAGKLGYSFEQVSSMIGASKGYLSLCKSTGTINPVYLRAICNVLGVSAQWLMERDNPFEDRVVPPDVDTIRAYCKANDYVVDPDDFYRNYSKNGWKVNGTKMIDWLPVLKSWNSRELDRRQRTEAVKAKQEIGGAGNAQLAAIITLLGKQNAILLEQQRLLERMNDLLDAWYEEGEPE